MEVQKLLRNGRGHGRKLHAVFVSVCDRVGVRISRRIRRPHLMAVFCIESAETAVVGGSNKHGAACGHYRSRGAAVARIFA